MEQTNKSGDINISIGKAIKEDVVFGINLNYQPSSQNYYLEYPNGYITYKSNNYGIGIFYRKYKSLGKDFFLFGQAGAGYAWSDQSGKDSTGTKVISGSGSSGNISATAGISYKISKKFLLEISIPNLFFVGYSTNSAYQSINSKNDSFTISTSLSSNPLDELAIGFRLIL